MSQRPIVAPSSGKKGSSRPVPAFAPSETAKNSRTGKILNSLNSTLTEPIPPPEPVTSTSLQSQQKSSGSSAVSSPLNRYCDEFLSLCLSSGSSIELDSKLNEIRSEVLFHGIPDDAKSSTNSSLRGKVWKLMLGLGEISSADYLSLIERGKSNKYQKIRGDSFRTFPRDEEFKSAVNEMEIIRVLNSFVQQYSPNFTYCQGMNTICAPFLYCLPEVAAYYSFARLIAVKTPLYWLSSHIGVEAGCTLVDRCLEVVDRQLFDHLNERHLQAYVYAFHCVSSLSASIPPFRELVKLWDFLLTFGPHFNILCVVAQIISLRAQLLESSNPKEILDYRKWPQLNSAFTISVAMSLLPHLSKELYQQICQHGHDPAVAEAITGRKVEAAFFNSANTTNNNNNTSAAAQP